MRTGTSRGVGDHRLIRRHNMALRLGLLMADGFSAFALFLIISMVRFGHDWVRDLARRRLRPVRHRDGLRRRLGRRAVDPRPLSAALALVDPAARCATSCARTAVRGRRPSPPCSCSSCRRSAGSSWSSCSRPSWSSPSHRGSRSGWPSARCAIAGTTATTCWSSVRRPTPAGSPTGSSAIASSGFASSAILPSTRTRRTRPGRGRSSGRSTTSRTSSTTASSTRWRSACRPSTSRSSNRSPGCARRRARSSASRSASSA